MPPFPREMYYGTPEELKQRAGDARNAEHDAWQRQSQAFDANPEAYESGPLGHNAAYVMKSRHWNPAIDALERFSTLSPEAQNQSYADMAQQDAPGPLGQWSKYSAVLNARGAQMPQPGQFLGRRGYAQQQPYSHVAHDGLGSTDELIQGAQSGAPALPRQPHASQAAFKALQGYYGR